MLVDAEETTPLEAGGGGRGGERGAEESEEGESVFTF